MGYLDEAIRDHLELQRRRGVPNEEIARAEAEALGPVGLDPLPDALSERAQQDAEEAPVPEGDDAPAEPAAAAETDEPEPEPEPLDQPTQAFTAVERAEAGAAETEGSVTPEGEEADELDKTPEFLQETPEHDRLWFEQKPPKDFDFS